MIHQLLHRALPARVYTRLGLVRDTIDRARFRPYVATGHLDGKNPLPAQALVAS